MVVVQILKNFNGSPSTDCPPCARVHDQASGGGEDDEEEQEGEEPGWERQQGIRGVEAALASVARQGEQGMFVYLYIYI